MSSFFLPSRRTSNKKLKGNRTEKKSKPQKSKFAKGALKAVRSDEEIASDSEAENASGRKRPAKNKFWNDSDSENEYETAPEKRLRLAKDYLSSLEVSQREEEESEHAHRDAISHRLRDDVLQHAGKLQRKVADKYVAPSDDSIRKLKGHMLSVTCVALTPDDNFIYSGSKDCCIIKWDLKMGKKEVVFPGHRKGVEGVVGHTGHVQALAVSYDGKFLASGGADKVVHAWDLKLNIHLHTFRGHKDTVTGVAFQSGTHQLFSSSFDRTVKVWNLDEMAYVETLFGHQEGVSSIDCLQRERPVTAGTSDRSLRVWKVMEESQLVFHGHTSSVDAVRMINDDHMISGSQDGTIALWNVMKKKPLVYRRHHQPSKADVGLVKEHWVSSVAAYPNTDLLASGSNDGLVVVWKCGNNFRTLEPIFTIPLSGFVNALVFTGAGDHLIAGVGQEHRYGRWWMDRGSKNRVFVIPLKRD